MAIVAKSDRMSQAASGLGFNIRSELARESVAFLLACVFVFILDYKKIKKVFLLKDTKLVSINVKSRNGEESPVLP